MSTLFTIWLMLAVFMCAAGIAGLTGTTTLKDRTFYARIILSAWIWPLVLVGFIIYGLTFGLYKVILIALGKEKV